MPNYIRSVLDALHALVEAVGAVTLPQPKLIPIKVTAGKPKR